VHGLPSMYSSWSCEEALAECLSRTIAKEYTPPPKIKEFLEKELLSVPFKPIESDAALHRGRTLLELGKSDEAMKILDDLIAREPNNGFAYWFRGNVWQQNKDWDRAIQDYSTALQHAKTRLWEIHEDRGDAYWEKKDFNRAIEDYTYGIASRNATHRHYQKRSNAHRANGSLFKALADNRPADSLRNDSPLTEKDRSSWLIEHETDKAIEKFTSAITLQPDYFRPYALRAKAWQKKGDLGKALADLNIAIRIQPEYANNYQDRAIVLQAKGALDKAIADYDKYIQRKPKEPRGYVNRSTAWIGKGDWDKAIADCDEAIRVDSSYAIAYHNRGYAYRQKGQYDKCIADYKKVLFKDYGNQSVRDGLAEVLSSCPDDRLRDGKLAVFLAKAACEATQWKKASYLDTLAAAYAETGDFDKAVEYQQKALGLYPEPERKKWQYLVEQYKSKKPYREK
jgi:tetratricopeptide (TPR) repeat protein